MGVQKDDSNDDITDSESLKFIARITGRFSAAGNTKVVEIAVPLKKLKKILRTLEMPLIYFEIYLLLTWSENYVITN